MKDAFSAQLNERAAGTRVHTGAGVSTANTSLLEGKLEKWTSAIFRFRNII